MDDLADNYNISDISLDKATAGRANAPKVHVDDVSILDVLGRPAGEPVQEILDIGRLRDENNRLHCLFDAYQSALDRHAIVAITDRRGKIMFTNNKFCNISGYTHRELLGQPHRIVNSGHHPRSFFIDMWQVIGRGEIWHGEICNRAKSGASYWVDTTIVPILDARGRIEAYVSIRYDITKRKLAETALQQEVEKRRQAEMLLLDVIETVPDGIAAFDADDRLVLHNRAYVELNRQASEAIRIGATFEEIVRCGIDNGQYVLPRDNPAAREAWIQARLGSHHNPGKPAIQELAGGRWLLANERRSPSGHTIGSRTDITELKRSEAAAKFHAEHDPLTGLYNRSVLDRRLLQAVDASLRSGRSGALVVADLDGFKAINDAMGHAAGDRVLVAVAERMQSALRKADTVVRLGGDEFALIMPHVEPADAARLARRLIAAVGRSVSHQRRRMKPEISLGIALFPRDGLTVETLLRKADMALYQAKGEDGSAFRIFSRSMRAADERQRKQASALAAAVAADRIDIALQPQFRLRDCKHSGFEALARWRHAGEAVPPSEFIPVAEAHGLIVDLGERVLQRSLMAMRSMKQSGLEIGRVAVNIAAAQLRMPEFPARLAAMVVGHGLAPDDIELELTENILLDREHERIAVTLRALRRMGFTVALDDFGTGYASLAHLSRFPVDKIKIDRSFVRDMLVNPDVLVIVRAMVGLAHSLGVAIIAEGIETDAQLEQLIGMDCACGQGYIVSPPLEPDAAARFLEARRMPLPRLAGSAR